MSILLGFSLVAAGYLIIWPMMFGRIFFDSVMFKGIHSKADILVAVSTWLFIVASFSIPFQIYYGEIKL